MLPRALVLAVCSLTMFRYRAHRASEYMASRIPVGKKSRSRANSEGAESIRKINVHHALLPVLRSRTFLLAGMSWHIATLV